MKVTTVGIDLAKNVFQLQLQFASNTHSWVDCAAMGPGMGAQFSVQIQALACGGGLLMS